MPRMASCLGLQAWQSPCWSMREYWGNNQTVFVDQSIASKSRLRGSCKVCAFFWAALSKHAWEQTVHADRGRVRSASGLRTPISLTLQCDRPFIDLHDSSCCVMRLMDILALRHVRGLPMSRQRSTALS